MARKRKIVYSLLFSLPLFLFGVALAAPQITLNCGNAITNLLDNSATVSWTTDIPSTSQVEYNKTGNWPGTFQPLNPVDLVTNHSVKLDYLSSSTLYYYRVRSSNGGESISSACSFQTEAAEVRGTKRVKYFIGQKEQVLDPGEQQNIDFSIFLGDLNVLDSRDLDVQSAFVEIKGVASSSSGSLMVSIDDNTFSSPRAKTFGFESLGHTFPIKILYDITDYIKNEKPIESGQENSYNLSLKAIDSDVFINSSRLIITFFHKDKETTCYKDEGYLVSSTFDTGRAQGAAFNSIEWRGENVENTSVKLQMAASSCVNGAFNPPSCNSGTWQYLGPDCTDATYYEPLSGEQAEIRCFTQHNNKRYFRYKVTLGTDSCDKTPKVEDVVVNWSL